MFSHSRPHPLLPLPGSALHKVPFLLHWEKLLWRGRKRHTNTQRRICGNQIWPQGKIPVCCHYTQQLEFTYSLLQ